MHILADRFAGKTQKKDGKYNRRLSGGGGVTDDKYSNRG